MRRRALPLLVSIVALTALLAVGASPSGAAPPDGTGDLSGAGLEPEAVVDGAKTSALAQSDPDLLARTDAARVPVLVKLDYDSIATYTGGLDGLPATSPGTTGRALTDEAVESSAYATAVADIETEVTDAIVEAIPEATVGASLRVVYGGVALTLPANRASDLLAVPGVVAVQSDALNQPLTDSSPEFIGAPSVWDELGGDSTAGAGVLYGNLDTGVWPEHPSFVADPALPAAPLRPDGDPIECNFGDNPLTPEDDVFECNDKLVGGRNFIESYVTLNPGLGEVYPDTARDSNGHGTHTASTSAGAVVESAEVFGVDRGTVRGVAPGAAVVSYKVCGARGCYSSDTSAAVEAAILDGVDVINYSISGGEIPFSDPTELAFLDAYAAGVFVSTSAGNSGPAASTANHLSPWTTAVAASTQVRQFSSTLTLHGGGETFVLDGVSIGAGVDEELPVVLARDLPGYEDELCAGDPPSADAFEGLIVACRRGNPAGRVVTGFNVHSGGAAGMVMYNLPLQDALSDNHWLPAIHLPDGTDFVAFVEAHDGVTGSFTPSEKRDGQPDVVAAFSSRGPAGGFVKPDVSAPGVQILAGTTPTPESTVEGPPGEYFQAIAGTSMSSPHVAGAGLLLAALHPDWTPGQIRSALMTTAVTELVKEDLTTPADPFDVGSGRIDLDAAMDPGLTLDETAANYLALTEDPVTAPNLNIPSINVPELPGRITTTRTFTNVGGATATYRVRTTAAEGSSITVSPATFTVAAGASRALTITIESTNDGGQEFGSIELTAVGRRALHLPVAFVPQQTGVSVTTACDPGEVAVGDTTECTVTVVNDGYATTTVSATTRTSAEARVTGASDPATVTGSRTASVAPVELAGRQLGTPSVAPGTSPAGFLPLSAFGISPTAIGDEQFLVYDTPSFVYNGAPSTRVAVNSNGYLVVGGSGASSDNACCPPQELPDTAPPNNVLAPFWSDLDGTDATGIYVATLTDGTDSWIVVEWSVHPWGSTVEKRFQVWIGSGGAQDISFTYPADARPDLTGLSEPLVIGAENENGSGGQSTVDTPPTGDLVVTSTEPTDGETLTYTVEVEGAFVGDGTITTEVDASGLPGTTLVEAPLTVTGDGPVGDAEWVDRVYRDLLGRPADAGGLDFWVGRLDGGASRASVARQIARSDDHLGRVVDAWYLALVERSPGAAERAWWITDLRARNGSERVLVSQLVGSAEFLDQAGQDTGAFVDQVFLRLAHRLPDAAGRAWWIERVDGEAMSRSLVGSRVFGSAEVRGVRVDTITGALLDREPSPDERTAWSEVLRTQGDLELRVLLVSHDDYGAAPA